ncbi:MAG: FAD-dependent oxidoreductase [Acidobacteria bacterium]|nr:MAG: FAD-dependent oxidoreductase [Acidobacteriota bacterium]
MSDCRIMESIDVAVIGGGVTGLATAASLARRGFSTCALERHPRPGLDTSTHNSGVIHAGLYYPRETLKTRLCIEGRPLLYHFCRAHSVDHQACGKIVVAHDDDEMNELHRLYTRGRENGVEGLELVDRNVIARLEPNVQAKAGLLSRTTGIVDAEGLVRALFRSAEAAGAIVLCGTRLIGADARPQGIALRTERETILAAQVVNAAGLYADDVSALLGGETFTIYPCRGEYVELAPAKRHLINGLVYPVPHPSGHGLGVHVVRQAGGAVWLGPTALYRSRKDDYETDRLPVDAFVEPARRLIPQLRPGDLRLAGSGIRPKLHPPSESFADFMIRRDLSNPRVVQAAGIESPGLTACLAVGNLVSNIVAE